MFKRFFGLMVVGFLAFGLFGAVRSSAYQAGWSNGFASGQAVAVQQAPAESAGAEAAAPAPQAQPNAHYGHHGYYGHGFAPFGWFFGGLLRFFFILFLLSFIFKFIGFMMWRSGRWRRRGKYGRGPWRHGHHGPPWMHHKGRGRHRRRRDYDDENEQDERSDKERYYDEYGPDSPIVDL